MSDNVKNNEIVQLSLPFNPAYVFSVRLTASSIATRCGFDVDEVEDIKVAISEACTFIINKLPKKAGNVFTVEFVIQQDAVRATIRTKSAVDVDSLEDDMSIVMIKALMDEFEISNVENEYIQMSLSKKHKTSLL